MSNRFVILLHSVKGRDHYDLMLENGDSLATWQFESFPSPGVTCSPLPPHRKAYLTYEGPVSNDRGEVTRIDEGCCELRLVQKTLHVKLCGKKIAGEFILAELTGDKWSFNQSS